MRYWFKRRRYGYGWIPVTWQGWLTLVTYFVLVIVAALLILDEPEPSGSQVALFLAAVAAATLCLAAVSWRKGPKPKWRWGKSPQDVDSEDW